jgi:uncharacterized protein
MIVSGDDFCGRQKEINELSRIIESNNRAYVYGERRIGKTSLVIETGARLKMNPVHIDLMGIKSEDDLCRRIVKAIISYNSKSSVMLTKVLKAFASLRPSIGIDPMSGSPSIGLAPSPQLNVHDLNSAFNILCSLKNTYIFFDEFQDILKIKESNQIMSVMRSYVQKVDNMAFVFSGSIRNEMINIFSMEDAPFYKAAFPISLGNIEEDNFSDFVMLRFKAQKIMVDKDFIKKIIKLCYGIPGDIMRLCESIMFCALETGIKNIDKDMMASALQRIYSLEKNAYEMIVQELSNQQLKTLVALARIGVPSSITGAIVELSGIPLAGSVNKAMKTLVQKRVVTIVDGKNKISNPFLKSWLLTQNF